MHARVQNWGVGVLKPFLERAIEWGIPYHTLGTTLRRVGIVEPWFASIDSIMHD